MGRAGWVLVVLLLSALAARAGDALPALELAEVPVQELGAGYLSLWRDPAGTATLEDAQAAFATGAFVPLPGNLSLGYAPDAAWLRFLVRVPEGPVQERWLEVAPPFLDYVDAYRLLPGGAVDHRRSGDLTPVSATELDHRNVVFRYTLAPGTHEFFLRVQAKGLLAAVVRFHTPEAWPQYRRVAYFQFGLFFGVLFAVFLGSIALGLALPDRLAWLFAFTILVVGLQNAANLGLLRQFLLPEAPAVSDALTGPLVLATSLLNWWFFAELLELRRYQLWFYRVSQGGIALSAVVLLLSAFGAYQALSPVVQAYALFFFLGAPVVIRGLWRRGGQTNRFLVFAYLTVILTLAYTIAIATGFVPFGVNLAWAQAINALLFVVMFFTVLMLRAREGQRALVTAEAEADLYQERARLLSLIAHELRTPVAKIDAARQVLELVEQNPDANPGARPPRLAAIRQATERLKLLFTLVNDREQGENRAGVAPPLPVTLLLQDLEALCGPVLRERLQLHNHAAKACVRADAREIAFALLNLLEGVAQATPRASQLSLTVSVGHEGKGGRRIGFELAAPPRERGAAPLRLVLVRSVFEARGGGLHCEDSPAQPIKVEAWLPEQEST